MTNREYEKLCNGLPLLNWYDENGLQTSKFDFLGKKYTARLTIDCTHLTISSNSEILFQSVVGNKKDLNNIVRFFFKTTTKSFLSA